MCFAQKLVRTREEESLRYREKARTAFLSLSLCGGVLL